MRKRLLAALACSVASSFAQSPRGAGWDDATVDWTFGDLSLGAGWRRLYEGSGDEHGVAIARTADGGSVVAAQLAGGGAGARIGLFRLDRGGRYVTSGFGNGGRVFKDAWLTDVTGMAIDAQGRIVVIGPTPGSGGARDVGVVRFNPDGSDDTGFGGDGGVGIPVVAGGVRWDSYPNALLVEADGRIIVASNAYPSGGPTRFSVLRVNADGTLDSGFGDFQGVTISSFADGNAYVSKILPLAGGHYLVAGTSEISDIDNDFGARILRPGGGTWAGLTGAATFHFDVPSGDGTLYDNARDAVAAGPATVVIAGTASGRFAAVRVRATGTGGQYTGLAKDATFTGHAAAGTCTHCYVSAWPYPSDAAAVGVRSDGRILIAGSYSGAGHVYGLVSRLLPNGHPDSDWVAGTSDDVSLAAPTTSDAGSLVTRFTGFVLDGGRVVATGSAVDSSSVETDYDAFIMRFRADLIFAHAFE